MLGHVFWSQVEYKIICFISTVHIVKRLVMCPKNWKTQKSITRISFSHDVKGNEKLDDLTHLSIEVRVWRFLPV